jgi:hypothetical protein
MAIEGKTDAMAWAGHCDVQCSCSGAFHGSLRYPMSRKSATIFGQGTIPEPSTPHIGKGVALVARTVAFVYI